MPPKFPNLQDPNADQRVNKLRDVAGIVLAKILACLICAKMKMKLQNTASPYFAVLLELLDGLEEVKEITKISIYFLKLIFKNSKYLETNR